MVNAWQYLPVSTLATNAPDTWTVPCTGFGIGFTNFRCCVEDDPAVIYS